MLKMSSYMKRNKSLTINVCLSTKKKT